MNRAGFAFGLNRKFTVVSVEVAAVEPFIVTVAPGRGSDVAASRTTPETVCAFMPKQAPIASSATARRRTKDCFINRNASYVCELDLLKREENERKQFKITLTYL